MFSPALVLLTVLGAAKAVARTHWFIFGDSYTTTTFDQNSTQPSDANPLGNPDLPGLTFCGRGNANYVYYASIKYNTTVAYSYNFAVGGATTDRAIIPPGNPKTSSVAEQIGTFATSYAGPNPTHSLPWTSANSLFSVWIGINDVGDSYRDPPNVNQSELHDKLIVGYFNNLKTLYTLGARNFLLLNVPPTDRSPLLLGQEKVYQNKYKAAVLDFNAKLAGGITKFKATNPTTALRIVDTHGLITRILDDPHHYGFADGVSHNDTRPAIDHVVWCNTYHISPKTHDYVAQAIRDALRGSGLL